MIGESKHIILSHVELLPGPAVRDSKGKKHTDKSKDTVSQPGTLITVEGIEYPANQGSPSHHANHHYARRKAKNRAETSSPKILPLQGYSGGGETPPPDTKSNY